MATHSTPPISKFARSLGITTSTKKQRPPLHPSSSVDSSASYGSLRGVAFLSSDDSFGDVDDDLNSSTLSMYSADLEEGGEHPRGLRAKSATSEAFERALSAARVKESTCCPIRRREDFYYDESFRSRGGFVNCVKEWNAQNDRTISLSCIVILGMSNVVPWLSFISCGDYFESLFPKRQTQFIFPVLNMSLLTAGTIATTFYGRSLPLYARLLVTNAVIVLLLLSVPLLVAPAYEGNR